MLATGTFTPSCSWPPDLLHSPSHGEAVMVVTDWVVTWCANTEWHRGTHGKVCDSPFSVNELQLNLPCHFLRLYWDVLSRKRIFIFFTRPYIFSIYIWICLIIISKEKWHWPTINCCIVQFSSVTQSCPTLCDPKESGMPGFPVHHWLPELARTHVHWVISDGYC